MFYFFDFSNWLKMIKLVIINSVGAQRRGLLKLLLILVPLRLFVNSVFFFLDYIFFPRLWFTSVKSPVFVIGHARSGTTLVHRLLVGDDNFSAFKYYELLFPSLIQKKLIRFIAYLDGKIFFNFLRKRLSQWEVKKFGKMQHIHKMGLTIPEEDDLILFNSCASGFWMTKLPFMGDLDFFHLDARSSRYRSRLMGFYKECIRRQLYINGDGKIHLSKNPTYCGRVESIIEEFPDAKFVLLYRNPFETIPSLLKLLHVGWRHQGNISREKIIQSTKTMTEISFETYTYPESVLANHPRTLYSVVDYRELVSSPYVSISKIYQDLQIDMSEDYSLWLKKNVAAGNQHDTSHKYSLSEFQLSDEVIYKRLEPFFKRFNWVSI